MPILMGAGFAVFVLLTPQLLAALLAGAPTCCCGLEGVPIGIVPALMAYRQDATLTPGEGFRVAFIAGGLGAIAVAVMMFANLRGSDTQQLHGQLYDLFEQLDKDVAKADPSYVAKTPDQLEAAVSRAMALVPFVPVVGACLITVLAGLCGLVTVRVLRRRDARMSGPPPPPPPVARP